jgi:uncharacterized OB-fold protein
MSENFVYEPLSGEGSVYSFCVVRRPDNPAFAEEAPYLMLDVQLAEGIRLVSRLADESDAEGLEIGDRLTVEFKPVGDGSKHLPFFRKAAAADDERA